LKKYENNLEVMVLFAGKVLLIVCIAIVLPSYSFGLISF
jgi:hypothetical protein